MTEKEKMLAGELYDANYNENLIKERYLAKDKCYDYNQLRPSNHEEIEKLINNITIAFLYSRKSEYLFIFLVEFFLVL